MTAVTLLAGHLRTAILVSTALALLPLLLQLPASLAASLAGGWLATAVLTRNTAMPPLARIGLVALMLFCVALFMGIRPGRDTGCALLAAMLAIKGCELRTLRDAHSTLGFALFAPFGAFLLEHGPLTLLLGLVAVVAILGNLMALTQQSPKQWRDILPSLRHAAVLLGLAAPLALLAFWLIPRLSTPLWGLPERALARPGLDDEMAPGQWLDLMADDSAAFRARFDGPAPEANQRYWRGPVLSQFDGWTWRRLDIQPTPAPPPPADIIPLWRYQIDYEPTDKRELVALDLPLAAPPGSRLDSDYSLYSLQPLNRLTRWELASHPAPLSPSPQLTQPLRQRYLQLPEKLNPRTLALGRQWRQQAGNDDTAIIRRAIAWITRDFSYTLNTPYPGRHTADEFLFDQQAGFCEHFSSAFAVLMRSAGIPARVVTGYAGGVRNRYGNYWLIRRMDAHAWNEVWLDGQGWVRIDPTAAVAPENILDTLEDRLFTTGQQAGGLLPVLDARWQALREGADWLRQRWNQQILGYDAAAQARLFRRFGQNAPLNHAMMTAIWILLSLMALAGLWWWQCKRARLSVDPVLQAWQTMGRRYCASGLGPDTAETALHWAHRVHARTCTADALITLAERYNSYRYRGLSDPALLRDLRRHHPAKR